jgi:hypothetical protein
MRDRACLSSDLTLRFGIVNVETPPLTWRSCGGSSGRGLLSPRAARESGERNIIEESVRSINIGQSVEMEMERCL